jgi:hypothetical protein
MFEFLKKPVQTLSDSQLDEVARDDEARSAALAERARRAEERRLAAETAEAEQSERQRAGEAARLEQEAAVLRSEFGEAQGAVMDALAEASVRVISANELAARHAELAERVAGLNGRHLAPLRVFLPQAAGGPAALGGLVEVVKNKLGDLPDGKALLQTRTAVLELVNERPF